MDEMNSRMRPNMEKVLRAMDVIPPFDSHGGPPGPDVTHTYRPPAPMGARSEGSTQGEMPSAVALEPVSPPPEGGDDIPTFDLGEKILAEQRRMTARKRKGPGVPEPAVDPESNGIEDETPPAARVASTETVPDDVAQLQQIVADIVSRDIERLCKGLTRAAHCPEGRCGN